MRKITWKPGAFTPPRVDECVGFARRVGYRKIMRRFQDHFSDVAAAYAAHRPTYPAALVDFLAESAPRRDLAWDAGCGSGQLSVLLAERFARVIATDASPAQIAHAAPHPNVAYACAPAEDSGLPPGVADLAVAAQAAHWFDLPAYYAEVRRVGRAGALVALVTYGLVRVDHAIDRKSTRLNSSHPSISYAVFCLKKKKKNKYKKNISIRDTQRKKKAWHTHTDPADPQ